MRRSAVSGACALAFLFGVAVVRSEPSAPELEDSVASDLVQLEVSVDGPPEIVDHLTSRDFSLVIGDKAIDDVIADRMCSEPAPGSARESGETQATTPSAAYLFFFDQPHLTQYGRVRALETARELVGRLIVRGARAAIVSSAVRPKTLVPLTDDPARLLRGLDRLRDDPAQADTYAALESTRTGEVQHEVDLGDRAGATSLARQYAQEEWWEARRAEQRLGLALGILQAERPPRGVFYFGDTLRQDAGQFYLRLAGTQDLGLETSAPLDFDRVAREALSLGVHIFAVQAEGMTAPDPMSDSAEGSLRVLGLETGGEGFVHGTPTAKIADHVERRFGCFYLLSFKPNGLKPDVTHPVTVRVRRKGASVRAQGLIVVPSVAARRTMRLLSAFADREVDDASDGFLASTVFLSLDKKGYHALVQVRAPPSAGESSRWDLGASIISRDSVRKDFSARISANSAKTPVVLEKEITIGAGEYEIVAVGQEGGDRVLSSRLAGELPKPGTAASISPIAVVQERPAAFVRDGQTRTSGSLVFGPSDPLAGKTPIAVIALVCRDPETRGQSAVRAIKGESEVKFRPISLDGGDRCVQIRDVIAANTLGPGRFDYEIAVRSGERELANARRALVVSDPASTR